MAEARLYLADYQLLDGAECGTYPHGQKYIYAPLALFVVEKSSRQLLPVAIQCKQKPASDNPIFTPRDGWNWTIAKTIVETADGNVHEAVTHLARTHLFMEPFVVSMHRQIGPNHPLARLLSPHFEATFTTSTAPSASCPSVVDWPSSVVSGMSVSDVMRGTLPALEKHARDPVHRIHGIGLFITGGVDRSNVAVQPQQRETVHQ